MFEHCLFLGLPITESYLHQLKKLSPELIEIFIQNQSSEYLQKREYCGISYLGKCMETPYEMAALDFLQTHVYSLLKKLIPDYPYDQHPLVLLPLSSRD